MLDQVIYFALGIGLSASCGFRVFVPLLLSSIAMKYGYLPVNEGFVWLASTAAVVTFGIATLAEIAAFYIPVVDNALDYIAKPLSIAAGTVITASMLTQLDIAPQWLLALIAGGGTAGVIQSGTTMIRLGSTATTAGIGNPIFATIETILSFVSSLLAFWIPLVMAILALLLVVWVVRKTVVLKNKLLSK